MFFAGSAVTLAAGSWLIFRRLETLHDEAVHRGPVDARLSMDMPFWETVPHTPYPPLRMFFFELDVLAEPTAVPYVPAFVGVLLIVAAVVGVVRGVRRLRSGLT